ncbi:MAG: acyl carrier protein [Colwellia sp.]|nr:acyl carrier protein [Colwellia sp.]
MTTKSSKIEKKLILLISEINDTDPSSLNPSMSMSEAQLDSLDAVNLLFEIEDEYDISIDDSDEINERMNLGTISELALRIEEEIEKSAESVGCPS